MKSITTRSNRYAMHTVSWILLISSAKPLS